MQKTLSSEFTILSSKGQIVLPKNLREQMSLEVGHKFLILSDGENILLKPVQEPNLYTFKKLVSQANAWAKEKGLKESDISEAVKKVRAK